MDGDGLQDEIERLLDALEGIRDELAGIEPSGAAASPDPLPAIATMVLAAVALLLGAAALVVAWRALRVLAALRDDRDATSRRGRRAEFGAAVRRYSELLGVEAVTGRSAARGDTAAALRSGLDHRLGIDRDPGALELLEEVAASRRGLTELPRGARASANGLAAMTVEWSIDRWVEDPDAWLRDHRERHRLRVLASRPADDDPESAVGDTRIT